MVIDQFLVYEILGAIKFTDRLTERATAQRPSLMINGY